MEFCKWLKKERERQGIRQMDLSAISGISQNTISNCECGRYNILLFNAEILAQTLGHNLYVADGDIDQVKAEMCDKYCRYPVDNITQEQLDEICEGCPFNRVNVTKLG